MVVLNNEFRSRSVSHSFKTIVFHGAGMGQRLIAYVKDVFESHTYTVPRSLLDDSP